uniref:non-specific serine/threonine protein kinase n=1 Tax=Tetraodon nigroviridis TaxID=99883 RepID=B7ZEX2_TETNG|nr:double-stranded RNA activated protein kinase 1 [Tetraodon nigroviridis]
MKNYISLLNEQAQKEGWSLRYEDVGCDGPDHFRTFKIVTIINDRAFPEGVGKNKKDAKQKAAENAWTALMQQQSDSATAENPTAAPSMSTPSTPAPSTPAPSTPATSTPSPSTPSPITQPKFVCWLNEYGHKNWVKVKPVESTRVSPQWTGPCCRFVVGDKEYPEAVGKTKREAKEEAARLVYNEICGSEKYGVERSTPPVNQPQEMPEITDMMKSVSVTTADRERNYISLINEHCQKKGFSHSFVMVDRQGPSHGPQFYYQLSIDGHKYPVGEGKTAKEARQNAAQLAWPVLQSPSCSGVSGDVPAEASAPKSTIKNCENGLETAPVPVQEGVGFSKPPATPKDQSSDVKCRRRLAVHFPNAHGNSKEESPVFNGQISASEKTTPRFTSEFDSISRLGSGGYGHVFKARNKLLGSEMAVKIVLCDEKALREAQALSDLDHCNIIRYYTCWLEDSGYDRRSPPYQDSSLKYLYIQMELCSTENLKLWIEKMNHNQNQERKKKSLSIFRQIVSGVEYIHSRNLIHRDLKPENIMFSKKEKEKVKIGDFGLVTVGAFEAKNLEERTVYKGTPWYMPPEQKDKKTYDRKVDIFPLGLIYFELLWKLSSIERKKVWNGIRNQETPAEFSQNYPFEDLMIKKMLSVNPEDRPEAKAVQRELEKNEPNERKTV